MSSVPPPERCQTFSGGPDLFGARDVKFLDTLELTRLADAFTAWTERAGRPDVAVSRNRVRLIYLMLRHTGARLGEVLALNDKTDIDLDNLSVMLGAGDGEGREVQIPAELGEALAAVFSEPATPPCAAVFSPGPGSCAPQILRTRRGMRLHQGTRQPEHHPTLPGRGTAA